MSSTGRNIKRLREMHGMTQADMAKIAGVSDKAVSTWENGIKEPRMGAVERIAAHFGVKKSQIVDDADIMGTKKVPVRIEDEQELDFIRRILALSPDQKSLLLAFVTALEGQAEAHHDKP